ncbi:MAG: hypothetical protein M3O22_00340 [Pseudomonadota bacterium]|nr:hypothetical protein [Pseudomonadota bacterium]
MTDKTLLKQLEAPVQANQTPSSPGMQRAMAEAQRRVEETQGPGAYLRALPEAAARTSLAALTALPLNFGDEIMARVAAEVQNPWEAMTDPFSIRARAGQGPSNLQKSAAENLEKIRAFNRETQELSPTGYALASIGGGLIGGSVVPIGAAANAAKSATGALGALGAGIKGAATAAPVGAIAGFGAGEGGIDNRLDAAGEGAMWGAGLGGGFPIAGSALKGIGNVIVPRVAEGLQDAVQLARKYKIPLGLDQVTGSKARQFLTSTTGRIPLSGGNKLADAQQKAFNRSVLKTINVEADRVSEEVVDSAARSIGEKFDDVLAGKTITITPDHVQRFQNILDDASQGLAADKVQSLKKAVDRVLGNLDENQQISGEKINDIRSSLTKISRSADPGIKQYLDDIVETVVDVSTEGNPAARELLTEARYQWKNLKTLEPLLAKASTSNGNIGPGLLREKVSNKFGTLNLARGNAGELGDLAKVGELLKSKIGDTGTAERLASYSAFGGGLAALNPLKALGALGAAAGYQAYNRFQPLVKWAASGGLDLTKTLPQIPGTPAALLAGPLAQLEASQPRLVAPQR